MTLVCCTNAGVVDCAGAPLSSGPCVTSMRQPIECVLSVKARLCVARIAVKSSLGRHAKSSKPSPSERDPQSTDLPLNLKTRSNEPLCKSTGLADVFALTRRQESRIAQPRPFTGERELPAGQ